MYERKTIIKNLLKKYNKTYISVVENLDREKAGCVSSCNFKVYFDVLEDSILIEDVVTKENMSVYYEFMSDKEIKSLDSSNLRDIKTGTPIITTILSGRMIAIRKALLIHPTILDNFKKYIFGLNDSVLSQSIFGIKDTLKPINEYIAEIKKSEQYIALMSKK